LIIVNIVSLADTISDKIILYSGTITISLVRAHYGF